MSARLSADDRQRAASNPEKSVFVAANAGSGKTKVLIDRIARLLLEGAPPSTFLCITYTKAAAAEMQRRLYKQLGDWCVADDASLRTALTKLSGGAGPSAGTMAQARRLFAQALESPGGLKIQTIHAFCERLLARFPLEAGVAPGFEIADDVRAQTMLAQSWSAVGASDDAAAQAALARFASRLSDERFQQLLRKLVEGRAEMRRFLAHMQDEAIAREALAARHETEGDSEGVARAAVARAPWDELRTAQRILAGADGKSMGGLAARIEAADAAQSGDAFEAFHALKAIVFTQKGEAYKSLLTKGVKKDHPDLETLFDALTADVEAASEEIRAAARFEDAAAALNLSTALDRAYTRSKALHGVLDFADLIEHAVRLLTQTDAAPWVLYKLDGGLRHILIDEGQDTSPAQWSLIEPLQSEFFAGLGARGERRTMFAVGDPKQSIYSFQGADPESFRDQALKLSRVAAQAFEHVDLDTSFRSTAEVLKAVDATFAKENLGGDIPGKFDVVQHNAFRVGEVGRVEWWPVTPKPALPAPDPWDTPQDIERADSAHVKLANEIAARIKAWIAQREGVWTRVNGKPALRPMTPGDVLILVRTRGPLFRQVLKALKRAGLPVAGADRMVLRDEISVEDCLSLLRVASDPADDLAVACLLKSPFIGLIDDAADLAPLAIDRKGASLWSRLAAASEAKYAPAQAFVRTLIDRAGEGAYALLSWALESMDCNGRSGWEKMFARLGPEVRDPLEELLARALSAHKRGAATLDAFLAEVERDEAEVKREMEEAAGAVRIMTVHGAKGLEAPVVIVPDTTAPPKTRFDDDLFLTQDGPVFSASKAEDDHISEAARTEADERNESEQLRLLYVALTRARDRLVVCGVGRGPAPGKAHEKSWHTITGEAMARVGAAFKTPWGDGFALGEVKIAPVMDDQEVSAAPLPDWVKKDAPALSRAAQAAPSQLKKEGPAISPRGAGAMRFRRGLLLHGLLQRLPDIAPERREAAALAWLKRQEVRDHEAALLTREALNVIVDARFASVFGPGSRAEAPIVGRVKGLDVRGIVDRLVVRADEVEIIDFKSDRPSPERAEDAPEGYVLQMALYRAVLAQIFPGREVRCALIWTEKPLLVELPGAMMDAQLAGLGAEVNG